MPRIPKLSKSGVAALLARWEEFEERDAWKRSRRGNLWRTYDGMTVTVFLRGDRKWGWCIADGDERRFSTNGFDEIADAMTALGEALGLSD